MCYVKVIFCFSYVLAGKRFFVIFIVFLQECGSVQAVGAVGPALAAVDTVLDFFHLFLHLGRKLQFGGGTAQKQRHPGAVVDFNSGRTGGNAVAAAPAEVSGKLFSVS